MSSTARFVGYLLLLHLLLFGVVYYAFSNNAVVLIGTELLILVSAYLAYRLYRSLISPLRLLSRGAAALADRDFSVKLIPTGSPEMDRVVTIYNRMIDQLRHERVSGRQREEFLDRLVDSAELGVVILDFDGQPSAYNRWTEQLRSIPRFEEAVIQPFLGKKGERLQEARVITGPGNRRYQVERSSFVDQNFERGFLVVQDVTATLVSAEKDAYGKVIRMMAHEVNNTNTAVTSILRSLLSEAEIGGHELGELSREYLPTVIERAENMTGFMSKLARVVKVPRVHRQPVDLNEVLRNCGSLLENLLTEKDIELTYDLRKQPVVIAGDATLLEQTVINALTNAKQSIGTGGRIRLQTTDRPAGFVVSDNGPGIDPDHAEKLFTPFFSSKPNGQGIGLTLAREVLTAHGASFQLATDKDGWTRFRVAFGSENSLH